MATSSDSNNNISVNSSELQVNVKNSDPSGCCGLTSIHESTQVRSLRKSLPFAANIWQTWEQLRWSCNLFCMKQPLVCFLGCLPRFGRFTIGDITWLLIIIVAQIVMLRDAFSFDTDDSTLWWYTFGFNCGYAASTDYAFVWMLSQRNTVLNLLFGVPMERSIKYHKYLAWLAIFWSWMHFLLIAQAWLEAEDFNDQVTSEHNISGLIMLASVSLIFLFTLDYVRRHYWEFFLKSHWILFCIFLWSAIKHDSHFSSSIFLGGLLLWGVDLLWRGMLIFFWGNPGTIRSIESKAGGITKIVWENDDFIYEGGQYAFICIPAIDLTQWHPFSISSSPDDNVKHFHIRAMGDFTNKLAVLAKQDVTDWSRLQVFMEGPYGRLEVPLHRYSNIVLISGGIGITPMQSIWGDLMSMIEKGQKFQEIHFVWYIRDLSMVDEFDQIHWNAVKRMGGGGGGIGNQFVSNLTINGILLKTTYIFTKVKDGSDDFNKLQSRFGDGFRNGRPHCKELIDATAKNDGKTTVLGCGPAPMLEDIKNHCAENHIDCHTEVFTF